MAFIWHINFHTFQNKPVFLNPAYEDFIRNSMLRIAHEEGILLLEFEIMPTHVHLMIVEFPDFPRLNMLKYLKGKSAYQFFEKYPELREDLGGGHLWQVSYDKVLVTTHIQYRKTVEYVRRQKERGLKR